MVSCGHGKDATACLPSETGESAAVMLVTELGQSHYPQD
jgi:hypothetical protein